MLEVESVAEGVDDEVAQQGTEADDAGPDGAQPQRRGRPQQVGGQEEDEKQLGGHHTGVPALLLPPFVYQDAQAVEAAPGDEVETGAVPHAAEEHGVHVVDIGAELATVAGEDEVDGYEDADDGGDHQRHPGGLRHQGHNHQHAAQDEVGGP